ncbi:hypothetical protein J2S25_001853 [Mesobacillus stamsii]|uniref:Uncharacterized protein n=1 Tax=Mesobacillus stamsii TaxID=225347 RepID=A0ABU0FWB4_9BACI|nr:hypothetical protein [Mesobacillus stamsii]
MVKCHYVVILQARHGHIVEAISSPVTLFIELTQLQPNSEAVGFFNRYTIHKGLCCKNVNGSTDDCDEILTFTETSFS